MSLYIKVKQSCQFMRLIKTQCNAGRKYLWKPSMLSVAYGTMYGFIAENKNYKTSLSACEFTFLLAGNSGLMA